MFENDLLIIEIPDKSEFHEILQKKKEPCALSLKRTEELEMDFLNAISKNVKDKKITKEEARAVALKIAKKIITSYNKLNDELEIELAYIERALSINPHKIKH